MMFLLLFTLLTANSSQTPKEARQEVESKLHELSTRLHAQTIMIAAGSPTSSIESDRIFKELTQVEMSDLNMKGNLFKFIGHGFKSIPREIRTVGRDLGSGVMVFFISVEAANIVVPIILTAAGQAELAAAVVAAPVMIPFFVVFIAAKKIGKIAKENKTYGGKENRKRIQAQQKKFLKSLGLKSLEKNIYFDGEPLPKVSDLNRAMMHDKELRKILKPISVHYQWSKNERVLFMLAQAQKHFDEGGGQPPSSMAQSPEQESALRLENWTIKATRAKSFKEVPDLFDSMPLDGDQKAATFYRLWHFVIIPQWVKYMPEKGVKKFRCLKKNDVELHAAADMAGDRSWNPDDELKLRTYLTHCGVMN